MDQLHQHLSGETDLTITETQKAHGRELLAKFASFKQPQVGLVKTAGFESLLRGALHHGQRGAKAAGKGATKLKANASEYAQGMKDAAGVGMAPTAGERLKSWFAGNGTGPVSSRIKKMRGSVRGWRQRKGLVSKRRSMEWDIEADPTSMKSRGKRAMLNTDDYLNLSGKRRALKKARKHPGGIISGVNESGLLPGGHTVGSLGLAAGEFGNTATQARVAAKALRRKRMLQGGAAAGVGTLAVLQMGKKKRQQQLEEASYQKQSSANLSLLLKRAIDAQGR